MPADAALRQRLLAATGADPVLDSAIAEAFSTAPAPYTASVESCRRLATTALPGWRLHIGYGVTGVFPYAELNDDRHRLSAEAPTVPLAILRVLAEAVGA